MIGGNGAARPRSLLVADPEHRSGNGDQDQEEDGPGIDLAVVAGIFGMLGHDVPQLLWL
ncbi:hypothetical protein D3C72_2096670 [compost metagenome]